ncbi:MAG: RNA polymerase factor sigma-54 [Proteobacteria bacterium]|nr:RNA polymerase factor sigma-54 [Pseudomonadota bacterium]
MALELRQNLKLTQQLVMTPQLQQAIKLLQLSRLELVEAINQELEENPVLDESPSEEDFEAENIGAAAEEQPIEKPQNDVAEVRVEEERLREDMEWESYLGEYSSTPSAPNTREVPSEVPSFDNFVSAPITLTDHLIWQWRLTDLDDADRLIGVQIIGNLEPDGYLAATIEEIAGLEGVSVERVERILARVQELDPVGVAARNLQECLLIQLRHMDLGDSLAARVVAEHIHDLENKNYQKISRQLKVSKEAVFAAERVILYLDPRPGRIYNNEEPQYISPDVFIYKMGDDYVIVLNEDGLPKLRVSQYYRDILGDKDSVTPQAKDYIQGKLRSAVWLIRSIHQRQRTIYRVTESIIKFQREFLDKGVEYLRPLVLRDVAEDVQLHESTISRVTTNKYVHTPQGLFELKFFFDSPINRFHGESMASESVKNRIKQIIAVEDPKKPLSDQRIVEILRGANIDIARRTVAKYREMLGIASSNRRKKHY